MINTKNWNGSSLWVLGSLSLTSPSYVGVLITSTLTGAYSVDSLDCMELFIKGSQTSQVKLCDPSH